MTGDTNEPIFSANEDVPLDLPGDSLASYNPSKTLESKQAKGKKVQDRPELSVWSMDVASDLVEEESDIGIVPREMRSSEDDDEQGSSYKFEEMVGKGGFGEVWAAHQASLDRVVAIKRLRLDVMEKASPDNRKMFDLAFCQEALTNANLEHPNIVPVYDLGRDRTGRTMLTMKYIHGTPWHHLIFEDRKSLEVDAFLSKHIRILIECAQAVAYAHSRGVVHRDIKPQQVVVGAFGEVLLTDWGLSLVYDVKALKKQNKRIEAKFLPNTINASSPAGTPAFMAPEQTEPMANRVGPKTDIFLLGGVLYYIMTGRPPYKGETPNDVFLKARLAEIAHPHQVGKKSYAPDDLAKIAMEAMQAEPADRTESVEQMLQQLEDFLSGAGKRNESEEITKRVDNTLSQGCGNYGHFAEVLSELSRAEALWTGNSSVSPLREKAHGQFAEKAFNNKDLVLARLQATRLEEGEKKSALVNKIDVAETKRARREKQLKVASLSVVFLMCVIIIGASFSYQRYSRAAAISERQAEALDQSRREADDFAQFIIETGSELISELEDLDAFRQIADQVIAYYEKRSLEELTLAERDNLSSAYRILTLTEFESGLTDKSLEYASLLHEIAEKSYKDNPDDVNRMVDLAIANVYRGRANARQGDLQKAVRFYAEALNVGFIQQTPAITRVRAASTKLASEADSLPVTTLMDRFVSLLEMVAALESDERWQLDVSIGFERAGEMYNALGDFENALKLTIRAYELGQRQQNAPAVQVLRPNEMSILSEANFRKATSICYFAIEVGDFETATTYLELARGMTYELQSQQPTSFDTSFHIAVVQHLDAYLAFVQEDWISVRDRTLEAKVHADRLYDHDPSNINWAFEKAVSRTILGSFYLRDDQLDRSNEELLSGLEVIVDMYHRDAKNIKLSGVYAVLVNSMASLGEAYLAEGNANAAEELHLQIEESLTYVDEDTPGISEWRATSVRLAEAILSSRS